MEIDSVHLHSGHYGSLSWRRGASAGFGATTRSGAHSGVIRTLIPFDPDKLSNLIRTRIPGVSVSQVARRYDVNANQVFNWLKDPLFFSDESADGQACFLPVEIIGDVQHEDEPPVAASGRIEFDLAGGHRLRISGPYDPDALARLIRGLSG